MSTVKKSNKFVLVNRNNVTKSNQHDQPPKAKDFNKDIVRYIGGAAILCAVGYAFYKAKNNKTNQNQVESTDTTTNKELSPVDIDGDSAQYVDGDQTNATKVCDINPSTSNTTYDDIKPHINDEINNYNNDPPTLATQSCDDIKEQSVDTFQNGREKTPTTTVMNENYEINIDSIVYDSAYSINTIDEDSVSAIVTEDSRIDQPIDDIIDDTIDSNKNEIEENIDCVHVSDTVADIDQTYINQDATATVVNQDTEDIDSITTDQSYESNVENQTPKLKYKNGTLSVTIKKGQNIGKPGRVDIGSYLRITVPESGEFQGYNSLKHKMKNTYEKTKCVIHNYKTEPIWNETFIFNVADAFLDNITIELLRKQRFKNDKIVGSSIIPIIEICRNSDRYMDTIIKIKPPEKKSKSKARVTRHPDARLQISITYSES